MPGNSNNQSKQQTGKTIRAAVFRHVDEAKEAVSRLLQIGFSENQISVLCSDEAKVWHFPEYGHEQPAGSHTPEAVAKGGAAGALFGGLVTAGLTTLAGVSLLAAGPSFLIGGTVAGGFIAAMQTRGEEGALADFYDQALTQGDLLVAVEDHQPGNQERLLRAEEAFRAAGARSFRLDAEP